jgi:WD40 repeat protein
MAVCFHHEEVGKLLVAEKNGVIHLYNILSHQAILSVDSGCIPLMSADWSPSNSLYVAAIAAGELLVWDISRPRWWICFLNQMNLKLALNVASKQTLTFDLFLRMKSGKTLVTLWYKQLFFI